MRETPIGWYLFDLLFASMKKKKKGYKVVIFFFTLLIYTTFHMTRKPISVVKSVLHENCTDKAAKEHKIVTPDNNTFCDWKPFDKDNWSELLGNLDLAYLLAYAVSMFCSGHIAERVNIRYFLTIGMFLCGLSTSLFGLGFYLQIHNYYYYLFVQIFAGMVQASGWPTVVSCMGNWFGKKRRGFLMGLWNAHTSLGNILGAIIAAAFVETAWGLSFIVPGAIIIGMGIIVFLFLTPYPEDVGCHTAPQTGELLGSMHSAVAVIYAGSSSQSQSLVVIKDSSISTLDYESVNRETQPILSKKLEIQSNISFLQALLIPGVIEYSLCLFFAKLVSYTFLFWLPTLIKNTGTLDSKDSANLSAIMDAGGILGGIIAGIINDLTGASALTCSGMLVIAVPYLYVYYLYGSTQMAATIILLLFLGILVNGPYALITTAVSADLGTHDTLMGNARAIATVTAIIDGTGSLGAALGPLLTGLLLTRYGWKSIFIMLMIATALAAILLTRRVFKEIVIIHKQRKEKLTERICQEKEYA
uniref:Sugar phosphate exchanger 3 n=1 Tax=Schmidtea mediterranea TaxID=79327 RepID=A0A0H3YFK7_SCHMD|nr:slc37a-1 [Schmidtea mediterranea]